MVIDDCSIGEDEPATTGIATVVPNGASVGEIALGGSSFLRDMSPEGFPRLDPGRMMVGEIEAQLTGETLERVFLGVAMELVDPIVEAGSRVGPSSSSDESLSGEIGAGRRK